MNLISTRKVNIYFITVISLNILLISSCTEIEKTNTSSPDLEYFAIPLDIHKLYESDDFLFLNSIISDSVSVVQLGESIHMTNEFPAARLQFVNYLHQVRGYDILTLEGSAIDSWLAMDYLIHSSHSDSVKISNAQSSAWFGLWQTDAMREIMEYILQTQNSKSPLYLASFDIQPGSSRRLSGEQVIDTLFNTLSRYHSFSGDQVKEKWKSQFKQLIWCQGFKNDSIRNSDLVHTLPSAISSFKQNWIEQVIPLVASNNVIHGNALKLIPDNLMDRYCHCDSVYKSDDGRTYQIERDKLNAKNVLFILDSVSQSHKIMTWAHHSHANHTFLDEGNIPSMGRWLKRKLKNQLYTIGTFAGKGKIMTVNDDWLFPIAEVKIEIDTKYEVEKLFSSVSHSQYFMDLKQFQNETNIQSLWSDTLYCRFEQNIRKPTVLSKDYDGAIFIQVVSAPKITFLPGIIQWIPKVWGFLLQKKVLLIILLIVVLILTAFYIVNRKIKKY